MKGNLTKNIGIQKMIKAAKLLGGEKVILFGSLSKKGKTKANDLDLCVLVDKNEDILKFQKKFRLKLWQLQYDWSLPLDLHVYHENVYQSLLLKKDPFIKEVNRGAVIYD